MAALSKDPKPKGPSAAALARKRRIALRNKQAAVSDEEIDSINDSSTKRARINSNDDSSTNTKRARIEGEVSDNDNKPQPSITGIKKASRYVPGVPMTKEELKAWRKEARRVRNRESAAASRKRNKERIDELEFEMDALKAKYTAALKYIVDLEGCASREHFTPGTLRQDLSSVRTEPRPSPEVQSIQNENSPVPLTLNLGGSHFENDQKNQHIMISRPIACV
jgi:hypothetical protein